MLKANWKSQSLRTYLPTQSPSGLIINSQIFRHILSTYFFTSFNYVPRFSKLMSLPQMVIVSPSTVPVGSIIKDLQLDLHSSWNTCCLLRVRNPMSSVLTSMGRNSVLVIPQQHLLQKSQQQQPLLQQPQQQQFLLQLNQLLQQQQLLGLEGLVAATLSQTHGTIIFRGH